MQEKLGFTLIGVGIGMAIGGFFMYKASMAHDEAICRANRERHFKERDCPECVARDKKRFEQIIANS